MKLLRQINRQKEFRLLFVLILPLILVIICGFFSPYQPPTVLNQRGFYIERCLEVKSFFELQSPSERPALIKIVYNLDSTNSLATTFTLILLSFLYYILRIFYGFLILPAIALQILDLFDMSNVLFYKVYFQNKEFLFSKGFQSFNSWYSVFVVLIILVFWKVLINLKKSKVSYFHAVKSKYVLLFILFLPYFYYLISSYFNLISFESGTEQRCGCPGFGCTVDAPMLRSVITASITEFIEAVYSWLCIPSIIFINLSNLSYNRFIVLYGYLIPYISIGQNIVAPWWYHLGIFLQTILAYFLIRKIFAYISLKFNRT